MRYKITMSGTLPGFGYSRESLANAVWIAMHMLETSYGKSVTLEDSATGAAYTGQAIRDLAAQTKGWEVSNFDTRD